MIQRIVANCFNTLKLNAFYEEQGVYRVDDKIFKINQSQVEDMLKQLDDAVTNEDYNPDEINEYQNLLNDFKNVIKQYWAYLHTIKIPANEFDDYMRNHEDTDHIQAYHQQQQLVINAGVSLYYFEETSEYEDLVQSPRERYLNKTHYVGGQVLNRHNPFADVHIENQAFLYPNTRHRYTTLRFQLGHQMTKFEHLDATTLALKPSFKIEQSNNRDVSNQPITFDDTIAQRLPEDNNNKALFYL